MTIFEPSTCFSGLCPHKVSELSHYHSRMIAHGASWPLPSMLLEAIIHIPDLFLNSPALSILLQAFPPSLLCFHSNDLLPKSLVALKMSHSHVPELSESIDQVIQNGQSLSAFQQNPRGSESNVSINRTTALPPLPPSPARPSRSSPLSPRQDQMPSPLRSNPPTSSIERYGTIADRGEKDYSSSRKGSSRGDDEASRSSKSETLAGSPPTGNSGMNITDFFSSEVFRIVIHNPTTAHRFLKFCQSRACGENMEFLQKAGSLCTPLVPHI